MAVLNPSLEESNVAESNIVASAQMREKALKCLNTLPPFSPILNRLIASLADENVSFTRLADLIEKDTVVAGSVLHLVNSALYARRGTVNSVRHAISILGFSKLRNAVLGMSVTKMWSKVHMPATWSVARFNLHSSGTAILTDILAQKLPIDYPEGAFVTGLLHDVGRLLIAVGLPEENERILQLHKGERDLEECEREVLGFSHADLSAQALAHWNLPAPIQAAAERHHAIISDGVSGPFKNVTLAHALAAADQYVHCAGMAVLPGLPLKIREPLLLESLGLPAAALEAALAEFKSENDNLSQFFK